nr:MAG TPA: helix-turn-helix domain protein [Caudoviricetes sp.]
MFQGILAYRLGVPATLQYPSSHLLCVFVYDIILSYHPVIVNNYFIFFVSLVYFSVSIYYPYERGDSMQSFSNILYNLLKQKGISQRMLAEMANTTEATISRYLTNARRMPRADLVIAIAEALNVSTDYLLGLTSNPARQSLSAENEELLRCYSYASESDRKVIWAVLDKYQDTDYKAAASGQDKWKSVDSASRQDAIKKFEDE